MRLESLNDILSQFPDHDGLWASSSLLETEQKIKRKLLAKPADHFDLPSLELLTQLARVQALQGQFSEADKTLKSVQVEMEMQDVRARKQVEIRLLLEQGRLFALQMIPAKALVFVKQAMDIALEEKNSFFAIDAAVMLTLINPMKKQNETLQWALTEAETTTIADSKLWLPFLYIMNGWSLFDTRQFDRALEYFQKALEQPHLPQQRMQTQSIKWSIARTKRALGHFDEALDILNDVRLEFEAIGESNGFVYLEFAENLRQQQKEPDARPYFEMAYNILSKNLWFTDNKETELARMKELYKKRY